MTAEDSGGYGQKCPEKIRRPLLYPVELRAPFDKLTVCDCPEESRFVFRLSLGVRQANVPPGWEHV